MLAVTTAAGHQPIPVPLILIAAGTAASFVPVVPIVRLTPDLVLIGFSDDLSAAPDPRDPQSRSRAQHTKHFLGGMDGNARG